MRKLKKSEELNIAHFGQKNCMVALGGVEVVVAEIATRQAALGYNVTCFNRDRKYDGIPLKKVKKV